MSLRAELATQLMMLPATIRAAPAANYFGAAAAATGGAAAAAAAAAAGPERTAVRGTSSRARAPAATPARGGGGGGSGRGTRSSARKAGEPPLSTPRRARAGEQMVSLNGSPLADESAPATSVKMGGLGGRTGGAAASDCATATKTAIVVDLGSREVDLGDAAALGGVLAKAAVKHEAVAKLKDLQDEVAALLGQLGS